MHIYIIKQKHYCCYYYYLLCGQKDRRRDRVSGEQLLVQRFRRFRRPLKLLRYEYIRRHTKFRLSLTAALFIPTLLALPAARRSITIPSSSTTSAAINAALSLLEPLRDIEDLNRYGRRGARLRGPRERRRRVLTCEALGVRRVIIRADVPRGLTCGPLLSAVRPWGLRRH